MIFSIGDLLGSVWVCAVPEFKNFGLHRGTTSTKQNNDGPWFSNKAICRVFLFAGLYRAPIRPPNADQRDLAIFRPQSQYLRPGGYAARKSTKIGRIFF